MRKDGNDVPFDNVWRVGTEIEALDECNILAQLFLTFPEKFDPFATALDSSDKSMFTLNMTMERLIAKETILNEISVEDNPSNATFLSTKLKKWRSFKVNVLNATNFDTVQLIKVVQDQRNETCSSKTFLKSKSVFYG